MINKFSVSLAFAAGVFCSVASAQQLSVTIDGFGDPQAFNITDQHLDLRVTKLVPAAGTNTSTHILIEGLSPIEQGTLNYASTYSGIDVNTGITQDSGVLYLKMPQGSELPAGTVASPIVGVVQRPGDWDDYNPFFPITDLSNTTTGDSPQGIGDYDGSSIAMNLSNGQNTYLGSAPYQVLDADTIVLNGFTLSIDGGSSYQMGDSILLRDGGTFYGTLTNLDPQATYDSLIFSIYLDNIPDLDGDTIPDISDAVISDVLTPGQWNNTSIGWVYAETPSIGYSMMMGWVAMGDYPNLYHFELGWVQLVQVPVAPNVQYILYSPTLGWIITQKSWNGIFFQESGGWLINSFRNPVL